MFYTEPKLSLKVIQQLDQHHKHYEYAKSLVKQYKEGVIPNRHIAYLTDETNSHIVAYMLYAILTRSQAHQVFKKEGVDLVLPPKHQQVFYLDTLEVATPYQQRGIGVDFIAFATKFNVPILLQCSEDSESYWDSHGFDLLDYSWMIRG